MNPSTLRAASKLNLIRILSAHPDGLSLEDLQKITGHKSVTELKKELGELYMIEMYPYSPQDCVDIDFDGELVKIRLPIAIDKALPLSPDEWILLRDLVSRQGQKEEDSKKHLVESILKKINSIIPSETWEPHSEIRKKITDSIQNQKIIELDYWKRNSKEKEVRTLSPWLLWEENESYLLGFDLEKQEFRSYRIDCILSIRETDRKIGEIPKGAKEWLDGFVQLVQPKQEPKDRHAVLFAKDSSAFHLGRKLPLKDLNTTKSYFGETYYGYQAPIQEENWFINTILGYGTSIIVTEPKELSEKILGKIEEAKSLIPGK